MNGLRRCVCSKSSRMTTVTALSARATGKSAAPDYQKTTVYLSKQLHRNVRIACLKATPPLDMSDVVAQQLTDWLKMQDLDS